MRLGTNPPRSISSGGHGKLGATRAAVVLQRLPMSKGEFSVFSGIKQVFPSTYCVPAGGNRRGESSKGRFSAAFPFSRDQTCTNQ